MKLLLPMLKVQILNRKIKDGTFKFIHLKNFGSHYDFLQRRNIYVDNQK